MARIYEKADEVLILDRQLLQVGDHWLERRYQLLSSEWQTRLWTMQEGRVAANPLVQFQTEAVPVSQLEDKTDTIRHETAELDLFHHFMFHTGGASEMHFRNSDQLLQRWQYACQDLIYRSTTMATDEPICLSVALGLDLLSKDPHPSMKDIYQSSFKVPRTLLFCRQRG